MPFPRVNIHFNKSFGSSPRTKYTEDEETGIVKESIVECNEKLPEYENFTIENQIRAGIALQEVSTNIIKNAATSEKEFSEALGQFDKAMKKKQEETNN